VDRVTQILEEVLYRPGITLTELARALDAPKSSVHGFVGGLLAQDWLHEDDRRFFLGRAFYALTLSNGRLPFGSVSQADLDALHAATGASVFLGVQAGDDLIYVSVTGTDAQTGFAARNQIRRGLLNTAGGKAILAARSDQERHASLRRRTDHEAELVSQFLAEVPEIKRTHIAENYRHSGSQYALATVVRNQFGDVAAEITLVGAADEMVPRKEEFSEALLSRVAELSRQTPMSAAAG